HRHLYTTLFRSQQVNSVLQQGYQMMTPDDIDREQAAMDKQNAQDIGNITQNNAVNNIDGMRYDDNDFQALDGAFDAPVARLDDSTPPIGLDVSLDATKLPAPSNLETLGRNEAAAKQAETDDVMSRPMDVSDRSEEHTSELQSRFDLVCPPLLEE